MKSWLLALFIFLPSLSQAACFDEAARRYHVPVELLKAISKVESNGNPNARNVNKNGSYDIGHMQINSWWLRTLDRYGIDEKTLLDPCINTNIGAWVLAQNIARYGLTWNAVGAYNAATESKRLVYARKVARALGAKRKA
ncbi:UNVERIFIED_CONTAM: transglycosylase-like protein with SLT domain [Acidovorax defluvii]